MSLGFKIILSGICCNFRNLLTLSVCWPSIPLRLTKTFAIFQYIRVFLSMTYSSHLFYLFCLRFGLSRWPNIRMRLRQSFAIFLTYFVCFFLTDMLCFFLTHIVLFFSMAFVLSFFVWVSPCLSDLTSGWDWGKVLPFSEHIPLFSAAPMDHKNIGTRMAPTTFCGYNLHPATWDSFLFEIAQLTWQNKSLFFDLCSYLVLFRFKIFQSKLHWSSTEYTQTCKGKN